MHMPIVLAFALNEFGLLQFLLLAMIGVLIFGKRLPEVGKNLGKSIVEFKKGLASAGEPLSSDAVGQGQLTTPAQPAALPPGGAEEQNRKQQDEIKRLSEEVRLLKEQMAQNNQGGKPTTSA